MMMKRTSFAALASLMLIFVCSLPAQAESVHCTECGMMVDMNSKFAARIVQGDKTLYFCDIGDLFSYLKRKGAKESPAEVRDYTSGEWINARKAFFVHAENKFKTPMGWGIAAFKEKNRASEFGSTADFDEAAKGLI